MQRRLGGFGLVLMAIMISGCSGGPNDAPKVAPAAGVLNLKGAPVAEATVTFYPDKGPAGVGMTDAKGAFQVKTNGQLGATIGKHKVTVSLAQQSGEIPPADGNEVALLKETTIPSKYTDQKTTDLIIDIPAEGNKALVLDLTE